MSFLCTISVKTTVYKTVTNRPDRFYGRLYIKKNKKTLCRHKQKAVIILVTKLITKRKEKYMHIDIPEGIGVVDKGLVIDCLKTQHGTTSLLSLKSVTVPCGVVKIDGYAFYGCTAVERINLPTGLREISTSAFGECLSLKEVDIPQGVETIGLWAFENCKSLTGLFIPNSVSVIDHLAFHNMGEDFYLICEPLSHAEAYAIELGIPYEMADPCLDDSERD